MDRRVWILTIAAFVVGTVELVIAGIIEMIARDCRFPLRPRDSSLPYILLCSPSDHR